MRSRWLVMVLLCVVPFVASAQPKGAKPAPKPAMPAWQMEVKSSFGFIPDFVKVVPPEAGEAWWMGFKGLWLGETALPGKYKDLISIAVASQIPCQYCTYADTQFAMKLDGATQREVNEAVMMASLTRLASTILNGSGQDEAEFKKEADSMFAFAKKNAGKPPKEIAVTDGASAQADMQATFGMVPSFAKHVPPTMLAGLWLQMKTFQLNPTTAIPGKYKELIGLGVAAQIPCKYCMYFHREAAKMNGASQAEIDEAVAVAADTRASSALMYGGQIDMPKFKKEIDQAIRNMLKMMAASKAKT
jgi:AhpD family alkylhydroperoxidase